MINHDHYSKAVKHKTVVSNKSKEPADLQISYTQSSIKCHTQMDTCASPRCCVFACQGDRPGQMPVIEGLRALYPAGRSKCSMDTFSSPPSVPSSTPTLVTSHERPSLQMSLRIGTQTGAHPHHLSLTSQLPRLKDSDFKSLFLSPYFLKVTSCNNINNTTKHH